jgi:hypothetical protein
MESPQACPRCHSEDVVRIVYGMPGKKMVRGDGPFARCVPLSRERTV